MAEEAGGMVQIPDPIGVTPKYDYNSFVRETAKDIYTFKFFDLQGTKVSESEILKIADDSIFRAKILADALVMRGLLTED